MRKTIGHLSLKIIHESVSFSGCLLFEIFQKLVGHVSTLGEHVIQVAKPILPRLLLVLDVSVHLLALTVNIRDDLALIGNPSLLLLHQAIRDALDLCPDRIESIIMILDSVLFLLH